ncbi:MAG: HipA domain-containing protein, partial [Myxococcales bacterium]|nr:HipA domain-containing protein [Myxococcales bacterium]
VTVHGQLVGTLSHGHHENYRFEPEVAWREGNGIPVMSFQLYQQRPKAWVSAHLPVWFENLLPERDSELRNLLCKRLGLRDGQSMALLQVLGGDLPGAVEVRGDAGVLDSPEDSPPDSPQTDALRFSSLAGVQLKFSMAKSGTKYTLPAHGGHTEWIVKIPGVDMPLLPAIEHATMAWARAMNLPVPETQVVETSDLVGLESFLRRGIDHAFAIQRYDRLEGGKRVHQEDFAQVLNFEPRHKYGKQEGKRASMDTIAQIVQQACHHEVLEELMRRFAFVVASGNDDAHLKNWSFVYGEDSAVPTLAPVYDQVCTIAVNSQAFGWDLEKGPTLGLRLGKEDRFRALGVVHLDRLMERLVDGGALKQRFLEAIENARDTWSTVAHLAPLEMHEALERHWREVPLLNHVGGWRGA